MQFPNQSIGRGAVDCNGTVYMYVIDLNGAKNHYHQCCTQSVGCGGHQGVHNEVWV